MRQRQSSEGEIKTAVAYARVSTDEQAKHGSTKNQLAQLREYCALKGWKLVAEIEEPGQTGKTLDRPGIRKIEALAPSIDYIVATTIDRFHRKKFEWELFKREVLDPNSVEIKTIIGVRDTGDPSTWLADEMEQTFGEHYSRLTSWKTVQGMRRQAERGHLVSGRIPYGTMKGSEKGVPVKNPDEWPHLEWMFEASAAGHSFGEICRELNRRGIRTREGGEWTTSTIPCVIRNHFYLGEIHLKGEVFQAKHDCRIDAALWEAAQKPRSSSKRGGRPSDYVYLLSNVETDMFEITAPRKQAGRPVPLYGRWARGRGGKKYYYYFRADRVRSNGGIKAKPTHADAYRLRTGISAGDLEELVVKEVIRLMRGSSLCRDLVLAGENELEKLENQLKPLKRKEEKLEKENTKLDDLLIAAFEQGEKEVVKSIRRKSSSLAAEIEATATQIVLLERQIEELADLQPEANELKLQANMVEELWERGWRKDLKRVLDFVVEKVVVRLDEVLLYVSPVLKTKRKAPAVGLEPTT